MPERHGLTGPEPARAVPRVDARRALAYLDSLCDLVDARRPLARVRPDWWNLAIPLAASLSLGLHGCGGTVESASNGASPTERCADAVDNDGDGLIDCKDPDCPPCAVPPDAGPSDVSQPDQLAPDQFAPDATDAPYEVLPDAPPSAEVCDDGFDNDHNGLTDCEDIACFQVCGCALVETCTNGVDDDCDGLADCADPSCSYDVCCGTASLYAAPSPGPELCANGLDDDCDGDVDCADPQCASDACCSVGPSPEACGNGVDDDCDGDVDCADSECQGGACGCDPNACPLPVSVCETRACQGGACAPEPHTGMALDDTPGNCWSPYCGADGQVHQGGNDGDAPLSEACEQIICFDGSIQHYKAQAGEPCGQGLACDGDGACVGCGSAASCPGGNGCRVPTCEQGKCGFQNLPDGYVVNEQQQGDCLELACSHGLVVPIADDEDLPDDGAECTWDVCTHGIATHPAKPAGTPCSQGGTTCDGMGSCK